MIAIALIRFFFFSFLFPIVTKTLGGLSDEENFYDVVDCLETLGIESCMIVRDSLAYLQGCYVSGTLTPFMPHLCLLSSLVVTGGYGACTRSKVLAFWCFFPLIVPQEQEEER